MQSPIARFRVRLSDFRINPLDGQRDACVGRIVRDGGRLEAVGMASLKPSPEISEEVYEMILLAARSFSDPAISGIDLGQLYLERVEN